MLVLANDGKADVEIFPDHPYDYHNCFMLHFLLEKRVWHFEFSAFCFFNLQTVNNFASITFILFIILQSLWNSLCKYLVFFHSAHITSIINPYSGKQNVINDENKSVPPEINTDTFIIPRWQKLIYLILPWQSDIWYFCWHIVNHEHNKTHSPMRIICIIWKRGKIYQLI